MKKKVISIFITTIIILQTIIFAIPTANAASPIVGNGTNGIYIDIWSQPYTTYKNKPYGNTVTISEGGVNSAPYKDNGYCQITKRSISEVQAYDPGRGNFLGYVYLGISAGNEPLTKPTITTNKDVYALGEKVNISWTPSSSNSVLSHYWLIINTSSGKEILNQRFNSATSYSFTPSEAGTYTINSFATPVGSQAGEGSLTDKKSIVVMPKPGQPQLSVNAESSAKDTIFKWNQTLNTDHYKLIIKNTDTQKSVTEKLAYGKTSYSIRLTSGKYQAYLSAVSTNESVYTNSNTVEFSVYNEPFLDKDGWTYSDYLSSDITSDKYDIEYYHTYNKIASSSPGEDWIKGEFAKTEYENLGEPYWSNIELGTSNTRVLLNYIYYHHCSGSKGLEVNYEYTSTFTHYDWLSKNGVYEASVANDYADSRYKFYRLKWSSSGADAYCSSGTTCDGAHGAHGSRSYYWYKSSQYQNRKAVDYYYYTKDSSWVTEQDNTATAVTYRYKSKENDYLLGDVNNDGIINVMDVTALQMYIAGMVTLDDKINLRADVNFDGTISINDVTTIQNYTAGVMSEF